MSIMGAAFEESQGERPISGKEREVDFFMGENGNFTRANEDLIRICFSYNLHGLCCEG